MSGERKGPIDPTEVLEGLKAFDVPVLPLDPEHAAKELLAPISNSDPFDELLLTQAQELGMKLLTRDGKLMVHCIACIAPRLPPITAAKQSIPR